MRKATGFFITIILFLLFIIVLFHVTEESANIRSVGAVIDERVKVDAITLSNNSFILDRNKSVVSEIYNDENRIYTPYHQIPAQVIDAFIATEDRRFFEHKGYDPSGMARAFMINMKSNSIEQGASTVTQQLVRNLYVGHEQTYDRKFSELLYAFKLEEMYSKEEIIEFYLNSIFFHNGVYGFGTASHFYFSKPIDQLTLAEIAFLTAIPNNPTHYDPLKNKKNTLARQEWILQKMLEEDVITEKEFKKALSEKINLVTSRRIDTHPDYVTYIHHEFKQLISKVEGYQDRVVQATEKERNSIHEQLQNRIDELYRSGIIIETSLDPLVQNKVISSFNRHLPEDVQGAAAIVDHSSQQLIALTGGKDYRKFDFHRGFQTFRQPGSTIKPLLVYAPYLDQNDVPLKTKVNSNDVCFGDYCPKNYGGKQYGNVTITTAFKYSLNTPAVRMLDQLGVNKGFSYLEQFNFSRMQPEDYRLPSALGGLTVGISPLELTNAYTTFANDGIFQPAYGIQRVTDLEGNVLYEWPQSPKQVWKESTNGKMRELLQQVVLDGTATKAQLSTTGYIGGKTGTTNQFHDLWFVGLTDDYTAGVWVGKDTPGSIESINSKSPHLLIWKDIMN